MANQMRLVLVLTLICVVAAGILAWVDSYTAPRIAAGAEETLKQSLTQSLPGTNRFEPDASILKEIQAKFPNITAVYRGFSNEQIQGFVILLGSQGYSSTLQMMVGIKSSGDLERVIVLSQTETPGLGTNVVEPEFIDQPAIRNAKAGTKLDVTKDGGDVQALTGATITSRAALKGINQAMEAFKLIKQ